MTQIALERAYRLLEEVERRLQPLAVREALARWRAAVTGESAAYREAQEATGRLRRFLSQPDLFEEVAALRAQVDRRDDEYVKRQLDVVYAMMLPYRQDEEWLALQDTLVAELEALWGQFARETIAADEVDRKAAREAMGHDAAPLLKRLVETRNRGARAAGFPDFYALALASAELREEPLFSLLEALEIVLTRTRPEPALGPGETDLLDPVFAGIDPVPLAVEYFDAIGLRVDKVIARSVVSAREATYGRAFCLDVDASGDVRVYCPGSPTEAGLRTLLHQLGRAAYHLNIAKEFPYLLRRPAHDLTVEAAGHLFETMVYDEHWHEEWVKGAGGDLGRWLLAARARKAAEDAHTLALGLASIYFERAVYREPHAAWDELWRGLIQRFVGREGAAGASYRGAWADASFWLAPTGDISRILGRVAAGQLARMVLEELGDGAMAVSPAAGYLLIDRWFAHGARFPWEELVRMAFGRPLDVRAVATTTR